MKHTFTITTIIALTILAVLSGCKKDEPVTDAVKDICGNSYKYVKIGEQYWMAENMRCNKYDTESDRKGTTLSTSNDATYAPYYTDASDKSKWLETEYSGNLSDEQVSKLGYQYSWAAAVGLSDEAAAKGQIEPFSGNRQGICPNGWHIPTDAEWIILAEAIGGVKETYGGDFPYVGKKLKATSGWFDGGNGTDDYSFAALPACDAYGSSVGDVGTFALFWTATPNNSYNDNAYARDLHYNKDKLSSVLFQKFEALSVRCVRN